MRIAFVGKGGSGKTTLAALFTRYLAESGCSVLAIDADINQHLAPALGVDATMRPRPLAADLGWLKEHLRGTNPRVASADQMIKTTPPGRGSRLVRLTEDDEVLRRFAVPAAGAKLMVAGEFETEDIGVACYHAKTGAVELYLNHLLDRSDEYVVVDMTAGADAFASGLFTRFDLTVLVSEPTQRGVGVFRQYVANAAGHPVALRVVGNKVTDQADEDYLAEQIGSALLACMRHSGWVRAAERGAPKPLADLEPENRAVLDAIRAELDATERDWATFQRVGVEFHLRNAKAWANRSLGVDLAAQVDPDFVLAPA